MMIEIYAKLKLLATPDRLLTLSNALYIALAILTGLTTFSVVHFGNQVSALKQKELETYERNADARIKEAKAKSDQANAAALAAILQLQDVSEKASGADRKANMAVDRLPDMTDKITQQEEKMKAANQALVELKRQVLGRRLTESQIRAFHDAVRSRVPRPIDATGRELYSPGVDVFVVPSNPEALRYANQIRTMLNADGWTGGVISQEMGPQFIVGLHMVKKNATWGPNAFTRRVLTATSAIFECFSLAGIPDQIVDVPAKPGIHEAYIVVGSDPSE
jgi:hypothetical protein